MYILLFCSGWHFYFVLPRPHRNNNNNSLHWQLWRIVVGRGSNDVTVTYFASCFLVSVGGYCRLLVLLILFAFIYIFVYIYSFAYHLTYLLIAYLFLYSIVFKLLVCNLLSCIFFVIFKCYLCFSNCILLYN